MKFTIKQYSVDPSGKKELRVDVTRYKHTEVTVIVRNMLRAIENSEIIITKKRTVKD